MKATRILSIMMLVGLSVASLASQADAQSAKRYATMERSIAQAQAQWPATGGSDGNMRNRTAVYKSCMFSAGLRP